MEKEISAIVDVLENVLNLDMIYNSIIYLVWLSLFLGIYFLLRKNKSKEIWILIGNIIFYIWCSKSAIVIITFTSIIVYICTRLIDKKYKLYDTEKEGKQSKEQVRLFTDYKKKTKKYVVVAVILVVGLWVYVKVEKYLGTSGVQGLIVPLGISYYTLSMVGYMLDVYWRKTTVEKNYLRYLAVVTYFPHIVQGPIGKYQKLMSQMNELPGFDFKRVCFGFQRIIWGFFKKLVVADRIIVYTTEVFASNEKYGAEVILAIILCVIQLYADFSGCMDIVCGTSQAIGIDLDENFRQPFMAKSAQEFWARWHITLGQWTKDYIYLPIAMNTKFLKFTKGLKRKDRKWLSSFIKSFCPLIAVWIFTGLWHGTGADYLVWGLYWCTVMTISKEIAPLIDKFRQKSNKSDNEMVSNVLRMVRTFIIFAVGRTIVITGSLKGCVALWQRVFRKAALWTLWDGSIYESGVTQKQFTIVIIGIILMLIVDILHEKKIGIREKIAEMPIVLRWIIYYAAIFAVIIFGAYGVGEGATSFVYGAF